MSRIAVVLFNLGGPDSLDAVEPFLFNLFADPAIIGLPNPLRWAVAKLIARRRAPVARHIYAQMGNASPLLANTEAQARALEAVLGEESRVFVAMRYWPPYSDEAAAAVKAWAPDRVVLLPLYPQYSSTTTGSSLAEWHRAARAVGLAAPSVAVCCYPAAAGFIAALAENLAASLRDWPNDIPVRVLLSAHGLPKRVVARGDPYQWQVEATAAALRARVGQARDFVVCYQSRVGPLQWLAPATIDEIRRAGTEGKGLIVVPIAFVSEHSETLVELDLEYGQVAREARVARYVRVATVGAAPDFIACLATEVRAALARGGGPAPAAGGRLCPASLALCPCGGEARR